MEEVVVLVFFDTHCPPCISELSYLKSLHRRAGDRVVILSVDVDPIHDTVEVLRRFREKNGISWPILIVTSKVIDAYGIQYTPTTLLIDRDGFIYKGYIGWSARSSPSRLDEDINHLLSSERAFQIISLAISNLGFIRILKTDFVCPFLYCHGCPFAAFGCPIGIIQNFIIYGRPPRSLRNNIWEGILRLSMPVRSLTGSDQPF